jgi:hypothetical protein
MIRDAPDSDATKAKSTKVAGKMRMQMTLLERGISDRASARMTTGTSYTNAFSRSMSYCSKRVIIKLI